MRWPHLCYSWYQVSLFSSPKIKTNKNWWVHLCKQSSRWAARSYTRTIKTDKNRAQHLLDPSSSRAVCSYAQAWDWQESCCSHKKLQVGFSGCFSQWDLNSEQPKNMMHGARQSRMDYSPKSVLKEADANIRRSHTRRNSKMAMDATGKAKKLTPLGKVELRVSARSCDTTEQFKVHGQHPTSNHCYQAVRSLLGPRRSEQEIKKGHKLA